MNSPPEKISLLDTRTLLRESPALMVDQWST